jgi:HTH-type transcriptional regulator/antitoxin HigA
VNIKPIRNAEDHAWALQEIDHLWEKVQPGTPDGDRFDVLSALVDAYEREHFEIPPADPIEAIRFRMEQEGLTNKDLIAIFKTRARVSEILGRRRRLNLTMIRRLHQRLEIPIECLVRDYKLKTQTVKRRASSR